MKKKNIRCWYARVSIDVGASANEKVFIFVESGQNVVIDSRAETTRDRLLMQFILSCVSINYASGLARTCANTCLTRQ